MASRASHLSRPFFTLLLVVCSLAGTACTEKSKLKNKVLLSVNAHNVTTEQFAQALARKLRDYDALSAKDEANLKRAREQTIQQLVLALITEDYAAQNGVTVSQAELDSAVAEVRNKYPDDNAFRRSFAQENLSMSDWEGQMRSSLMQKKVYQKIAAAVPAPTAEQIEAYYNKNRPSFSVPARVQLRQIVVDKEDSARRLMAELQKGADFAKLAKEFSIAPESTTGGLTGWIEKGTLDVFDAAFKLNAGGRSKILKSPYGYHIYEVIKKEADSRQSLTEATPKITRALREQAEQLAFTSWLDIEVRKARVFRDDVLIQSIQVSTRGE